MCMRERIEKCWRYSTTLGLMMAVISLGCAQDPIIPPSVEEWQLVQLSYSECVDATFPLSMTGGYHCRKRRYFSWLTFGSAWVYTRPGAGVCQIWLGGETENPSYNGLPTQYCEVPLGATIMVDLELERNGGPARSFSDFCVAPGFRRE